MAVKAMIVCDTCDAEIDPDYGIRLQVIEGDAELVWADHDKPYEDRQRHRSMDFCDGICLTGFPWTRYHPKEN